MVSVRPHIFVRRQLNDPSPSLQYIGYRLFIIIYIVEVITVLLLRKLWVAVKKSAYYFLLRLKQAHPINNLDILTSVKKWGLA